MRSELRGLTAAASSIIKCQVKLCDCDEVLLGSVEKSPHMLCKLKPCSRYQVEIEQF